MNVPEQDPGQGQEQQEIPMVVVPGDHGWLDRWIDENGLGGDDADGFAPGPEGARCRAEWLRSRGRPSDAAMIAEEVTRLLRDDVPSGGLVTAEQAGRAIGMSAAWVREHATDLGAVRIGDGKRPRLRFDLETVKAAMTRRTSGETSPALALVPDAPESLAMATMRRAGWSLPDAPRARSVPDPAPREVV